MRHSRFSLCESRANFQYTGFEIQSEKKEHWVAFKISSALRFERTSQVCSNCHAKYSNKSAIVTLLLGPLEFAMLSVTNRSMFSNILWESWSKNENWNTMRPNRLTLGKRGKISPTEGQWFNQPSLKLLQQGRQTLPSARKCFGGAVPNFGYNMQPFPLGALRGKISDVVHKCYFKVMHCCCRWAPAE